MKRNRSPWAAVLACLLAVALAATLAACGGTHTRTITRTLTTTTTKALPPAQTSPPISCPGGQATMNCVLQNQAPPTSTAKSLSKPLAAPSGTTTTSSSTTSTANPLMRAYSLAASTTGMYGVDFGWGGLSATALKSIGARFAASYFSNDPSKNWTKSAADADHRAGIATVGVWESSATRATQGRAAGIQDAQRARAQADAVGNTTRPIDFAVDCDCTGASILGYFQGAHSVLGNRTDAYGGYSQVLYLSQHGVVGHENWQTYAWSGGRWLPASIAPLEQYLNGSAFDNDRAIAPAYAQWPYSKPKPVDPHRYDLLDKARRTFKDKHGKVLARAREDNTSRTWISSRCLSPARRSVCRSSVYHLRLLRGRLLGLHAHHRWSYGKPSSIGTRNQVLVHLIEGKRVYATFASMVRGR